MSSPNYVARIRPEVQAQIAGWGLPREELIAVYLRLLTELPSNPDRHLYEQITPPNLWAYHFTLGQAPSRRFFVFAVERHDYDGKLHIIKGRMDRERPPRSEGPVQSDP